jgi:hypothetical protein
MHNAEQLTCNAKLSKVTHLWLLEAKTAAQENKQDKYLFRKKNALVIRNTRIMRYALVLKDSTV